MYVCMYVCMCVYVCMYICKYVCMYILPKGYRNIAVCGLNKVVSGVGRVIEHLTVFTPFLSCSPFVLPQPTVTHMVPGDTSFSGRHSGATSRL